MQEEKRKGVLTSENGGKTEAMHARVQPPSKNHPSGKTE